MNFNQLHQLNVEASRNPVLRQHLQTLIAEIGASSRGSGSRDLGYGASSVHHAPHRSADHPGYSVPRSGGRDGLAGANMDATGLVPGMHGLIRAEEATDPRFCQRKDCIRRANENARSKDLIASLQDDLAECKRVLSSERRESQVLQLRLRELQDERRNLQDIRSVVLELRDSNVRLLEELSTSRGSQGARLLDEQGASSTVRVPPPQISLACTTPELLTAPPMRATIPRDSVGLPLPYPVEAPPQPLENRFKSRSGYICFILLKI